jgi:hypothetical protein
MTGSRVLWVNPAKKTSVLQGALAVFSEDSYERNDLRI